ncbi:hypothetical protein SAMN02745823_00178 [Sporobacter termitidis DSM 10068]|uniref:Peptidase M50 domain-containing protein n=1 Tax=Sporobacter termitidis DSM 10068 TaxID=1123282 RepID=A0A1M5TPH5_9FIRM|nr:site-2 protease family protein [Sporobacter termitidis]SHH52604.1 hypothetical protein SAMN02745823_00178 [Sporobacter termitidis DSM 10068]
MDVTIGKFRISGAALVALSAVYFFDFTGLFFPVLAAVAIHELGHLIALYFLRYKIAEFRIDLWGLTIRYNKTMSYAHELISAAAGPAASFALAVAASFYGRAAASDSAYILAGISLVCGAFNLLPVLKLDGGRMLYDVAALMFSLDAAEKLITVTSCAVIGALLTAGAAVLIWTRVNFTLLLAAAWLLISYCKKSGLRIKSRGKKVGCV